MTYRTLSDEQFLILRRAVAGGQARLAEDAKHRLADDLKVLTDLGLVETVELDVLLTEAGASVLDKVDLAWTAKTRCREPIKRDPGDSSFSYSTELKV